MLKKGLFFVLFCFTVLMHSFAQDGKLKEGKESLKTKKIKGNSNNRTSESSNNRINRRNGRFNSNIENPFVSLFWSITVHTFYGVFIEFPFERNHKMYNAEISNYSYKESNYGNFIYSDFTNYNRTRFDFSNTFVIENKSLYGNNFGVNFRFLKRFALDVTYLHLFENVNDRYDYFALYSGFLKYYRIRTQRFDAWFGLGAMHVGNDVKRTGFGKGLGVQWFIKKPVSLSFSHKWTNINQQGVHKTKLLVNYHNRNYQISSGYEHFRIGIAKINAFSVGVGASF